MYDRTFIATSAKKQHNKVQLCGTQHGRCTVETEHFFYLKENSTKRHMSVSHFLLSVSACSLSCCISETVSTPESKQLTFGVRGCIQKFPD
jgi:hypothetical protein